MFEFCDCWYNYANQLLKTCPNLRIASLEAQIRLLQENDRFQKAIIESYMADK
jgi:hypothetical protein